MDLFEKQQLAESIKSIVKARWFFAVTVFIQGLIIKSLVSVPLAPIWQLTVILVISYLYNIAYWLYIRRPPERMTEFGLKTIQALQVIMDALAIFAIVFLSGTVDKLVIVWYFVILMIGVSLYDKRGIALSTFFCGLLYSSLLLLEYYGFLTPVTGSKNFTSTFGNKDVMLTRLIGFNTYLFAAAFFCWFVGKLFRTREKRLQVKTDEAVKKSELLIVQTQQLQAARGELQSALTRSDIARAAATQARDEMEKANIQLKQKVDELEKFYNVTIGREVRMAELKEEIKELKKKQGKK